MNDKEKMPSKNNRKLKSVHENFSFNKITVCNKIISTYLKEISLPKVCMEERELCEGELTKTEVTDVLNKMESNETLGNDGLTKEFLQKFWLEINSELLLCFKKVF